MLLTASNFLLFLSLFIFLYILISNINNFHSHHVYVELIRYND